MECVDELSATALSIGISITKFTLLLLLLFSFEDGDGDSGFGVCNSLGSSGIFKFETHCRKRSFD